MPYDLIITGGRVVDPGREVDAVMDVAISDGRIAKVAAAIDAAEASWTVDARGKLVVPGLIDIHAHIFEHGVGNGLDPDLAGVRSGVTTIVDGGSAGSANYDGFHHNIIGKVQTRVLANLHIAQTGLATSPEARDANDVDVDATIETANRYKGEIIGIKVRACGPVLATMGIDYIKAALTAARESGVRLMVHIGDPQWNVDPAITQQLLPLLQADDLITHLYTGAPGKVLDSNRNVLPELVDANERGVEFDPAHGRMNMSFEVAKRMMEQGIRPASISTDITKPGRLGVVKSMTHTMSKFLALGYSLTDVIRMSTFNPAGLIGQQAELGTLAEGTTADIAILGEAQGKWTFDDALGASLTGDQALQPVLTFKDGAQVAVDYGPFPWGWLPNPAS
jgi:dihydroorotase